MNSLRSMKCPWMQLELSSNYKQQAVQSRSGTVMTVDTSGLMQKNQKLRVGWITGAHL